MKKILFILLLLITSPLVANPAHIQITKLSDSKRNQLFTDFMKNSGESCVVTRNFIQGTKKMAMRIGILLVKMKNHM